MTCSCWIHQDLAHGKWRLFFKIRDYLGKDQKGNISTKNKESIEQITKRVKQITEFTTQGKDGFSLIPQTKLRAQKGLMG